MSKLHHGIGYNSRREHKTDSLAYDTWHRMFRRSHCPEHHDGQPTDIGCAVDDRWYDFQDFADWFYDNPYSDPRYRLNEDLLIPGNKIYAPETCCFVPKELNGLLTSRTSTQGDLPRGVSFHKPSSKFAATVSVGGKQKLVGCYGTPQEAYKAYKLAKEIYVKQLALKWQDRIADDVFEALMQWTLDS